MKKIFDENYITVENGVIQISDERATIGYNYNFALGKIEYLNRNYEKHTSEWNYCKKIIAATFELNEIPLIIVDNSNANQLAHLAAQKKYKLQHIPLYEIYDYSDEIKNYITEFITSYNKPDYKLIYKEQDVINFLNTFTDDAPLSYIKSEFNKGLFKRVSF